MRIILVILLLTGCAAREYSSTDRKYSTKPQITCSLTEYGGHMRHVCCQANTCWFAD